MRILVGVRGAVLSLPWVIAFGVFARAYPPPQRRAVEALGLVFGVCFVAAVGSRVTPA